MNNHTLVIYDFDIMFEILKEIESQLNFKLTKVTKNNLKDFELITEKNYIIIS